MVLDSAARRRLCERPVLQTQYSVVDCHFSRSPDKESLVLRRSIFCLLCLGLIAPSASLVRAEETHDLRPAADAPLWSVEASLEVSGQARWLKDDAQTEEQPLKVAGQFAYFEQTLAANENALARTARQYTRAVAAIEVGETRAEPALREERCLILADHSSSGLQLFSPQGLLTRDELDLLTLPGSTAVLDELLPGEPVALGGTWTHSNELLAVLLNLDAVGEAQVTSKLIEHDGRLAKIELTGNLRGAIGGVATEIELKARYAFSVARQHVTWIALLAHEKRAIGHVGPGLDVTARLQATLRPAQECPELAPELLAELDTNPGEYNLLLEQLDETAGYRLEYDRRWTIMSSDAQSLALRFVDRGELVAQCNLSVLPTATAESLPGLERFQADIRRSLGKNFQQFVRAAESQTAQGCRLLTVEASGAIAEVPLQWHYFLVTEPRGRQVVLAVTVEESLLPLLGEAAVSLVDNLHFEPLETAARLRDRE